MRIRVIIATIAMFAMVLATPAAAQTAPSGEATSQTVGIDLELGDIVLEYLGNTETLPVGGSFEALDIETLATTVDDPFAEISVLPLAGTILGQPFGGDRVTVDSDGDAGQTQSVTTPLGTIASLAFDATADDDSALAILTAADHVAAQLDLIAAGASLSELLALSSVDDEGAVSRVGFDVTGLDAGSVLGSLLAELPLEVLLAIADDLIDVGALVEGELGEILDRIEGALDDLGATGALDGALDDLEGTLDDLLDVAGLEVDELALEDLQLLDTLIGEYGCDIDGDLLDLLSDPGELLDDITDALGGILGGGEDAALLAQVEQLVSAVEGCLESALGTDAAAVAELLGDLEGDLAELLGALNDLVEAITGLLGSLVGDLLAALDGLADVDAPVLGDIRIGMLAEADADTANASLECVLAGDVVDCASPIDQVNDVTLAITDALSSVLELLGEVDGDVTLELFGGETQTSTTGATNEATAVLQVLALHVPSVAIGLEGAFDGLEELLSDLELGGLVAEIETVLEGVLGLLDEDVVDLLTAVDGVLGGTDLTGVAEGIVADIDAALSEAGILDLVSETIGGLFDLLDLEIPLSVTTPGLDLVIDPTVTASYTPGAPAGDDDPTLPAPGDDPRDPALPTTGGGMALLGMLLIAGAVMLRRRLVPLP